jgi:cytidine deaminase
MLMPQFSTLSEADQELIMDARDACRSAYAPYSGFAVGSAVRTKSGAIFIGANLENAAYGVGMCAEVAAITAANSAGDYQIESIAVIGFKFEGAAESSQVVAPCGRCRQLILEASQNSGDDVKVFSCSGDLTLIHQSTISELLPDGFGPKSMGLEQTWPQMKSRLARQLDELNMQPPKPTTNLSRLRRKLP